MGEAEGREIAREGGHLDEDDPNEVRGYREEKSVIEREDIWSRLAYYRAIEREGAEDMSRTVHRIASLSDQDKKDTWVGIFHMAAAWGGGYLGYSYGQTLHLSTGWLWGLVAVGAIAGVAALWALYYILKGCLYTIRNILLGIRRFVLFIIRPALVLLGIVFLGWGTYAMCRWLAICTDLLPKSFR